MAIQGAADPGIHAALRHGVPVWELTRGPPGAPCRADASAASCVFRRGAGHHQPGGECPAIGKRRPKIVIVGAGFGGLFAAKGLAGAPADVIIIDKNNYHAFVPLIYQVAAAELDPVEIAHPVRTIARRHENMSFIMDEVKRVDLPGRRVITGEGSIDYDYLVLAAGSVTNFFGLVPVARHAFGMKSLSDAFHLRNHILLAFERASRETDAERRRAMLTFVVVGGGPTGVEFSATLSELIWITLRKDYPHLPFAEVRVILLEAAERVLPFLPRRLSDYTRKTLEDKGVEVITGAMVTGATERQVELKGMDPIPTETIVWTAGVAAGELAAGLGVPTGRGGRVLVEETLQVPGHPQVYVIGDMAYAETGGRPVPQVAPAAIQQAEAAAGNIRRQMAGVPLQPFRYKDPGTMVIIGRGRGVAAIGRRMITGFPAWILWIIVHIVRLIGFRNRLYVLSGWAWSYIFHDRIRLILGRRLRRGRGGQKEESPEWAEGEH